MESKRDWYMIEGNWHHCITFSNGERYVDAQIQTEHQREVDVIYNEGYGIQKYRSRAASEESRKEMNNIKGTMYPLF